MALEQFTVLDLTHMLSGPYGSMLLADLGARTIKVEPPGQGEGTRRLLENDPNFSRQGMGAYFLTLNRNKQSVCIDLKQARGLEVFYDLVKRADVVIDNFSVGVTKRLRIDQESLAKVNPKIVTCSITGFGETGPDIHRPAFDQVVQAMGGGMSITGNPQTGPMRAGIPIGDLGGGLFGVIGILSALAERERTGLGQHVDISMLDSQVSLLNYMATMYLMSGQVPEGIGNSHFVHVPYNCYPTADGHIIIACIGDPFFQIFSEIMDIPALRDPSLKAQPIRQSRKAEIDAWVTEVLLKQPSAHWLELLTKARIPCGPVNRFDQALQDPQVLARNMVVPVQLNSGETVNMPGNPVKLERAKQTYTSPPTTGQHTDDILSHLLGYNAQELAQLKADGIVA
jgi:crotonobetainyl-CoA:carnitine CoA-transferase CaiB-like acyl-CoA transferase